MRDRLDANNLLTTDYYCYFLAKVEKVSRLVELMEVKLPYDTVCPSVGWLVGRLNGLSVKS